MDFRRFLGLAIFIAIFAVVPAFGQQDDDVPTLTNDDVAPPTIVQDEPATDEPEEDPALTPEERADAERAKKTGQSGGPGTTAPPRKKKENPEEIAWRKRYEAAKLRADELLRTAQNAEIRVTEIRNQIADPNNTGSKDGLRAELERQGQVVQQAKQDAADAKAERDRLKAEGDAKGFKLAAGPSATKKSGAPNEAFHRAQFEKARQAMADAEREMTLYQNQVSELRIRQTNESGSGDNFVQLKLQAELNEALEKLEKARAKRDAAELKLNQARDEARRAGFEFRE